jgi:hypothetical protein
MIPAMNVASISPPTPKRAEIGARRTTKAAVGQRRSNAIRRARRSQPAMIEGVDPVLRGREAIASAIAAAGRRCRRRSRKDVGAQIASG